MKIFYKLFSFAFLLPFFSLAQSNYKPGFVVNLKGDTLRGFIDYREWSNNPNAISFKHQVTDASGAKYTPADISSFNINSIEAYQKYTGLISMDVVNTDHLTTGKDTSVKMADVFLRILQKGKNVTLYSYTDDLKARYFIGDGPNFFPKELVYRIYEANDSNGNGKTFTDETYLKQLNTLAIKYSALNDDLAHTLEKADYQMPQLMVIVSKINNITKQEFSAKYDDKGNNYFYGGLGLAIATTTPSPGGTYKQAGGKPCTSILPAVKFGINVFASPNSERLSFRFELSAALIKYTSTYDNAFSPYVNITYGYTNLAIAFSPQIIYNFYNGENLKVFAGGGIEISKYTYFSREYKNNKDGSQVPTSANPFSQNNFSLPIVVKTGISISKKIDIYADYLLAGPVSDDYVFRLNTSSVQVGVNYRFK
ncbi:outer membrane beta-barrel protein [Mucilaginibacter sp.]|uniref:outer membrane beta-barrel protein n=1 Tax=Mucilaginibacter sp. TaxID=1882438 RepID=UPI0025E5B15B|nr:outer membrane beta-barrel protein [Mucilaginibacter sp.]